jgi:hypothetical protein
MLSVRDTASGLGICIVQQKWPWRLGTDGEGDTVLAQVGCSDDVLWEGIARCLLTRGGAGWTQSEARKYGKKLSNPDGL